MLRSVRLVDHLLSQIGAAVDVSLSDHQPEFFRRTTTQLATDLPATRFIRRDDQHAEDRHGRLREVLDVPGATGEFWARTSTWLQRRSDATEFLETKRTNF